MSSESPNDTDTAPAALRDAADILARTAADEAEAIAARDQYRREGLLAIDPDPEIAARLRSGEALLQVRPAAMVVRDETAAAPRPAAAQPISGRLYLTTARLVLLARPTADAEAAADPELSIELADIDELAVVGERLLVSLSDGTGITIDAGRPRTLRVQVAAARAAVRSEAQQREEEAAPAGVTLALGSAGLQLEP